MLNVQTVPITQTSLYQTGEILINGQQTDKYYWKKSSSPVIHICDFAEVWDVIKTQDLGE